LSRFYHLLSNLGPFQFLSLQMGLPSTMPNHKVAMSQMRDLSLGLSVDLLCEPDNCSYFKC
jgi:hypothetical protein